jgi:hypothetical protein
MNLIVRVALLPIIASCPACQDPDRTFELESTGGQAVPRMVSRIIPGEGMTVVSGRLSLSSRGRLEGQLVLSFTDSGTVFDTLPISGGWQAVGDSLRLEYRTRRVRWNRFYPVVPERDTTIAVALGDELVFTSFGGIPAQFLGSPHRVVFRRAK